MLQRGKSASLVAFDHHFVLGIEEGHDIDELSHGHRIEIRHRHRRLERYLRIQQQLLVAVSLRNRVLRVDDRRRKIGVAPDDTGRAAELEYGTIRSRKLRQPLVSDAVTLVTAMVEEGPLSGDDIAQLSREIRLAQFTGFDEFNQKVFAGGARGLGGLLWRIGDVKIIDGLAVNGTARVIGWLSSVVRHVQSGYIYHYAFAMIIGLFLLMTFFLHR